MSVLLGTANLWCEIILVNDQHKTDRGQCFSVAINPTATVIESEGGDPINLPTVLIGSVRMEGQCASALRICHHPLSSPLLPWACKAQPALGTVSRVAALSSYRTGRGQKGPLEMV